MHDDDRKRMLSRLTRYTCLDTRGIQLTRYLSRGAHGIVLQGIPLAASSEKRTLEVGTTFFGGPRVRAGRTCAVKLVPLQSEHEVAGFAREVSIHTDIYNCMPDIIVQVGKRVSRSEAAQRWWLRPFSSRLRLPHLAAQSAACRGVFSIIWRDCVSCFVFDGRSIYETRVRCNKSHPIDLHPFRCTTPMWWTTSAGR
jgi:hypothetical protein